MRDLVWLETKLVLAIHDEQIAAYGGLSGVRDMNLLESALAKPQQAWAYEEPQPDMAKLAALYMTGIARNHPFNDANKRSSFASGLTFLALNGIEPELNKTAAVLIMVEVAEGGMNAEALAAWLRERLRKR
jgi:death-on-curing protein